MTGAAHVLLAGLPGSGKSTVAPLLAARLGRTVVDTDAAIEQRLGLTVADIFSTLGEAGFRAEERQALEAALRSPVPLVIAAGGGLLSQPGVLDEVLARATVVLLEANDDVLMSRLGQQAALRPLLASDPARALQTLGAARAGAHGHAQLRVRVDDLDPAGVAAAISEGLEGAIRVGTAHPYLVRVGAGLSRSVGAHVPASARRVLVIADQAVSAVAAQVAADLRARHVDAAVACIAGGEPAKQWSSAGALLEQCSEHGLERDDCIVAVGGGSIGDVAGMVAATYLRGIAWVVVPTTLLSMVDSAVGGKTAVNLQRGKNLAGVFWQPRAVLCDPEVLTSLDERSFRSAVAEIVKTSMIGNPELSTMLDARLPGALDRRPDAIADVVRGCCALKAEVVAGDERETGRRAVLNYGHTVGHAVEALTGLGSGLDHGEAVAFGMRVAGALSVAECGCPAEVIAHQDALLDSCGLAHRPALRADDIVARLGADKKSRGGVPRWVLLRDRGEPVTGVLVPQERVREALAQAVAA